MTRRSIELFCFIATLVLAAQKAILDAANSREHDRNAALNTTLAQIAKLKTTTQTPQEILRVLQQELPLPQPITLATTPAVGSRNAVSRSAAFTPSDARGFQRANLPSPVPMPSLLLLPQSSASSAGSAKQGTSTSENSLPPLQDKPPAAPNAPLTLSASPDQNNLPSAPAAQIPSADLKPLFDYVQDCRACQAQLAVAKQNSADDAARIAALTRERDAAISASKGGTFLRRLRRNAAWLALGAAAGYAASRTTKR